jgi:hypothetical protein
LFQNRPAAVRDILTPQEALGQIFQCFWRELNDLSGYSPDPPRRHLSSKPVVIDQGGFVAQAWGSFRDLTTDLLSLMPRHLSGAPRLNVQAVIAAAGAGYPDKERKAYACRRTTRCS